MAGQQTFENLSAMHDASFKVGLEGGSQLSRLRVSARSDAERVVAAQAPAERANGYTTFHRTWRRRTPKLL